MSPAILLRKMISFFRYGRFVQVWFLPVWCLLGVSRAVILVIPFRRLAPKLGGATGVDPWVPILSLRQEGRARQISRVVQLAAGYTPWESNCFPQAVTARLLLGLYGIPYTLFFGLAREENGEMKAHAWVAAGRVRVTGGLSFLQYTVVGCFASPQLSPLFHPTTPFPTNG